MNEDFNKNNNSEEDFNFEEDLSNNAPAESFEEEPNPFESQSPKEEATYQEPNQEAAPPLENNTQTYFTNDQVEHNNDASKKLGVILLTIIALIGLLITSVFGIINWRKNNSNGGIKANVSPRIEKLSDEFCLLDHANIYISDSISSLERVTKVLEEQTAPFVEAGAITEDRYQNFKDNIEALLRTESEIRDFSKPYLKTDLSIKLKPKNAPCNVEDADKYLDTWLSSVKGRIEGVEEDIDYLNIVEEKDLILPSEKLKASGIVASTTNKVMKGNVSSRIKTSKPKIKTSIQKKVFKPQSKKTAKATPQNTRKVVKPKPVSLSKTKPSTQTLAAKSNLQKTSKLTEVNVPKPNDDSQIPATTVQGQYNAPSFLDNKVISSTKNNYNERNNSYSNTIEGSGINDTQNTLKRPSSTSTQEPEYASCYQQPEENYYEEDCGCVQEYTEYESCDGKGYYY